MTTEELLTAELRAVQAERVRQSGAILEMREANEKLVILIQTAIRRLEDIAEDCPTQPSTETLRYLKYELEKLGVKE